MSPHAEESTTNADMSNDSAPLTNGETPQSRVLSVRTTPRDLYRFHKNISVYLAVQSVIDRTTSYTTIQRLELEN